MLPLHPYLHNLTESISLQVAPGICDGISARCALEAGFDCLYQRYGMLYGSAVLDVDIGVHSGAATTASRLGMPDLAIATMNDFVQVRVCAFFPKRMGSVSRRLCFSANRVRRWCAAWTPRAPSSLTLTPGTHNYIPSGRFAAA